MIIAPNVDQNQLKTANRYPWAVAILFFGALIGFFVPKFTESKDETVQSKEENIQRLTKSLSEYRAIARFNDSLKIEEIKSLKIDNKELKKSNDSLQKFAFDNNTQGLERIIKIIEKGNTSVTIKPTNK